MIWSGSGKDGEVSEEGASETEFAREDSNEEKAVVREVEEQGVKLMMEWLGGNDNAGRGGSDCSDFQGGQPSDAEGTEGSSGGSEEEKVEAEVESEGKDKLAQERGVSSGDKGEGRERLRSEAQRMGFTVSGTKAALRRAENGGMKQEVAKLQQLLGVLELLGEG